MTQRASLSRAPPQHLSLVSCRSASLFARRIASQQDAQTRGHAPPRSRSYRRVASLAPVRHHTVTPCSDGRSEPIAAGGWAAASARSTRITHGGRACAAPTQTRTRIDSKTKVTQPSTIIIMMPCEIYFEIIE